MTREEIVAHLMRFETADETREHLEGEHGSLAVLRALGDRNLTGRDLDMIHVAEHRTGMTS